MSAAGKSAGSPAVERLRELLGEDLLEHREFRGEHTVILPRARVLEALELLRDEEGCEFDYLTDLTAVHYPDRDYEFEVVYLLYSFRHNRHLRVKTRLAPGEQAPTAVPVWEGANWLEREVYDMFGIVFEGHPDLRRILMPDDYDQHPLRKEIPLKG